MVGKKFFLNAHKGQFIESKQLTPRHAFDEITGHIVHIGFKPTPYGETMRLQVIDKHNFYMLSIFVTSRVASAFFAMLPNINVTQEITFKIHEVAGKDFLTVEQFGEPVKWFYTPANWFQVPGDLNDRIEFFKAKIEADVAPQLQGISSPYPENKFFTPQRDNNSRTGS